MLSDCKSKKTQSDQGFKELDSKTKTPKEGGGGLNEYSPLV